MLIFCSTRKGCGQTATILKKEYDSLSLTSGRKNLPWPKPNRSVLKPNDKSLADLMESGIAFHHAGMDLHDRQLVERSFLDGSVSVVCTYYRLHWFISLSLNFLTSHCRCYIYTCCRCQSTS